MNSSKILFALLLAGGLASAQQYTISTVVGVPTVGGYAGDGNAANNAIINRPFAISVDSKGNYYLSDIYTHTVRMVTASTGKISTLAGMGTTGFAGDDGPGIQATLSDPHGVVADSSGNIYIADTSNSRIRKIDSAGNITTFAGNGTRGSGGDGTNPTKALLWFPAGLAIDASGNIYVADYGNSTIRKITSSGTVSTIAGTGTWGYSGDGGPASKAQVANPIAIAVDTAGNIYIGDTGSNTIRKIGTDGNIKTILSNVSPEGIAADSAGNVYYSDYAAFVVRKLLPDGSVVTIAGNGQQGFNGDNMPALSAQLNFPSGVAVNSAGRVLVADSGNQAIRLLTPVSFSVGAVTNAASSVQTGIAPGEIVTLFGNAIGPATLTQFKAANGSIGNELSGVSVTFNGTPAPLIYVSSGLVAAIAPYSLANATSADIVVSYQGNTSATTTVPVVAAAPGIFTSDSTGAGQAAAINQTGTVNSATNPAKPGSIISVYLTGEGQTNPAGVDGKIASSLPLPQPVLPVTAKINGVSAVVAYAGAAPTLVAGVLQVNIQIPATLATGNYPLVVSVGGVSTQTGVTIAIGQ